MSKKAKIILFIVVVIGFACVVHYYAPEWLDYLISFLGLGLVGSGFVKSKASKQADTTLNQAEVTEQEVKKIDGEMQQTKQQFESVTEQYQRLFININNKVEDEKKNTKAKVDAVKNEDMSATDAAEFIKQMIYKNSEKE